MINGTWYSGWLTLYKRNNLIIISLIILCCNTMQQWKHSDIVFNLLIKKIHEGKQRFPFPLEPLEPLFKWKWKSWHISSISSIHTGSICQLLGYHCAPSAFHVQRNAQYNMHEYIKYSAWCVAKLERYFLISHNLPSLWKKISIIHLPNIHLDAHEINELNLRNNGKVHFCC